jgi:UDP-glucose 4-epimerase
MTVDMGALRCVVLGAGGFIGINLCRRLAGRVHSLRAFGRQESPPDGIPSTARWIQGDFSRQDSVRDAIRDCDVVFHLVNSSTPASANADKVGDVEFNVLNTLRLLEGCVAEKVGRVVFVSSGGTVYGVPSLVPTPEESPTHPISAYGVSKVTIENYLHLFEYIHGLDHRVLRVSNPYGPYQSGLKHQGVVASFFQKALAGQSLELWGDGSVERDYVYIDDVTEALELSMTHDGAERTFNIGSGKGTSLRDIIAEIETTLKRKLAVERFPGRRVDVPVSVLNIDKARRSLGWTPRTDLAEGLVSTVRWMQSSS